MKYKIIKSLVVILRMELSSAPIVLMLVFRFELNTMCPYLYIINTGLVNISYERNPQL